MDKMKLAGYLVWSVDSYNCINNLENLGRSEHVELIILWRKKLLWYGCSETRGAEVGWMIQYNGLVESAGLQYPYLRTPCWLRRPDQSDRVKCASSLLSNGR